MRFKMIPIPQTYIFRHTEAFCGPEKPIWRGGQSGFEVEAARYMLDAEDHVKDYYLIWRRSWMGLWHVGKR